MTFDYRSLMSGQQRGPIASVFRGVLWLASHGYGLAVKLRNRKYDSGKSEIHQCGAPVISVGNLTTGGTGKTPIVCYLAQALRQQGTRVTIVSRGYGRGDADENDEALELHSRLPDVPHLQNPDRVEAARIAVEELEAEVILMDDGFQHRRLYRDANIVVVDAMCPFGFGHLLPRGLLREPVANVRRADLVIISRCGNVDEVAVESIESTIRPYTEAPIVRSHHQPTTLLEFPEARSPIDDLGGKNVAVLSAIGNPDAFVETVRGCGANVVATKNLPDHDEYAPATMESVRQWVRELGDTIDQVVCTHKDLVKLRTDRLGGKPLAAILIELSVVGDGQPLSELLRQVQSHAS